MKISKKELQKIAGKTEASRVIKKLADRDKTKIQLSTGEIVIIEKVQGGYEI